MKKLLLSLFILITSNLSFAQIENYSIDDEVINKIPDSVSVIGLGDPTHQEKTITNYRIDLIKKLVLNKGFSIIAIEGNLLELYKAYLAYLKDGNILHLEKAMYPMLNSKEMEELYNFVYEQNKMDNPILIIGFDTAFSGETFANIVENKMTNNNILQENDRKKFIKNIKKANVTNLFALFRNDKKVKRKLVDYSRKVLEEFQPKTIDDEIFVQALKNLQFTYKESNHSSDDIRDLGMANNIHFIQKLFPDKKIILFGSSTHLLKNPKEINNDYYQNDRNNTLGNELKNKLKEKYYFIGYSAISGSKYNMLNKNDPIKISIPVEHSIESQFMNLTNNAVFINNLKDYSECTKSRFLGHTFLDLNLSEVMDAIILIKNIEPIRE